MIRDTDPTLKKISSPQPSIEYKKTCEKYPGHYAPVRFSLTPSPLQPLPLFSLHTFWPSCASKFLFNATPSWQKSIKHSGMCTDIFDGGKGGRVMQTMGGGWIQWVVSAKWD
ncbi:hypothetical protein CEXT_26511 [Caerostris extrusa]|uniref:Uncharacterized protein n=1 Tax=Caerostris extrusa TaxID=172846 RepID=A0AAV4UEM6_CAEEX|nr:hypothetical protein CEXT_26511 [Caerostris extrusa]